MNSLTYLTSIEKIYLNNKKKNKIFLKRMNLLNKLHYKNSFEFKKLSKLLNFKINSKSLKEVPFIPANLFKNFDLKSIKNKDVIKILTSSGTTGKPSKIFLNKENSNNQQLALSRILKNILGNFRLPMLILDKPPLKQKNQNYNAKLAAIYGFSIFGKNHTYILRENGEINYSSLNKFLINYNNEKFMIFGFTYMAYQILLKKIDKKKITASFKNGILLHGGGWKKMENEKIGNLEFKKNLKRKLKLTQVSNYYGMVEQTGSIYMECRTCSAFTTSIYSDILIRDKNFKILKNNKKGFIQTLSSLPTSYPGHSILTEDIGEIIKKKKSCKLKVKHFLVHGRTKTSEVRGCSDT